MKESNSVCRQSSQGSQVLLLLATTIQFPQNVIAFADLMRSELNYFE